MVVMMPGPMGRREIGYLSSGWGGVRKGKIKAHTLWGGALADRQISSWATVGCCLMLVHYSVLREKKLKARSPCLSVGDLTHPGKTRLLPLRCHIMAFTQTPFWSPPPPLAFFTHSPSPRQRASHWIRQDPEVQRGWSLHSV